jgi:hypothetical protein
VAAATGSRPWPDALAHPLSVLVLDLIMARSLVGHARGTLTWRGRNLSAVPPAPERTPPATMGA